MTARLPPLPIDPVLPQLIESLAGSYSAVLRAPTGSGKTTRVPPTLLDGSLAGQSTIIMLEPRRVAARAAARRIAYERGQSVGQDAGYIVRFDQNVGPDTRIKIVTDGVLLRMLQDDPFLEQASIVIFDEFHERGLNADLALAMVRRVQQMVRPDLKIVVMSATLAVEPISRFLGNCPVIEAEGQSFPVDIRYQSGEESRAVPARAAAAVHRMLQETAGDVLVFLPGLHEIRQTRVQLESMGLPSEVVVMELYGDLSAEEQDAVLRPHDRRKVVLATNVVETSITIDGVTAVVDTGLARVLRYEPSVGLDRLVLTKISQASAAQRAGRAGRTRAGVCMRLWTERDHRARLDSDEPEVRRVDLAGPVLELLCWGETDPARFPWFEPPLDASLERACGLLARLGAVANGRLTDLGRAMARLPVHPRIARLLVEGHRLGVSSRAALVGALLSERDPFRRDRPATRSAMPASVHRTNSDLLDRVLALEQFEKTGRAHSTVGPMSVHAARHTIRVRDQLLRVLGDEAIRVGAGPAGTTSSNTTRGMPGSRAKNQHRAVTAPQPTAGTHAEDEPLLRSIFAAFPDRLARRREPGSRGAVMRMGRGVRLAESSGVMDHPLFVCVDIEADPSESIVRLASAVERDWLPADRTTTHDEKQFDAAEERVTAVRRTESDGLTLEEVPLAVPRDAHAAAILAEAAAQNIDRVLPHNDPHWDNFLARVRSLRQWMPELDLPAFESDQLHTYVPEICGGLRSFEELRQAPWVDLLKSKLTYRQGQALEQHAPERLTVPSGSRIALRYEVGRPPVLAARIQELFGWKDTPRIAGGRVAVLLHLLAPNMRPQQVTDDLQSFWTNTYPKIRSELRRRYPKHAWPENPHTASPQRRPGK